MILSAIRHALAWETVKDTGATLYQVNRISGKRRVLRSCGGHQPVDLGWLRSGEWSAPPSPPTAARQKAASPVPQKAETTSADIPA